MVEAAIGELDQAMLWNGPFGPVRLPKFERALPPMRLQILAHDWLVRHRSKAPSVHEVIDLADTFLAVEDAKGAWETVP